jgi:hypothetical protein
MSKWLDSELNKIAAVEELLIEPLNMDGKTYRRGVPIWSVVVDNTLYIRGYKGPSTGWYKQAVRHKLGRVSASGVVKDVAFESVNDPINDQIDAAYRQKYASSPYVNSIVGQGQRAATLRVMPRDGA